MPLPGRLSRPDGRRPDVVGLAEIADLLGVRRATVDQWRTRGVLPDPDWDLAGGPIWLLASVLSWARETGRLPESR